MTAHVPAIALRDVSKSYTKAGRPPTLALDNVCFDISEGEFISLVGPSGCGKSTLLKLISGLMQPTSGSIEVFGSAVTKPLPDVGMVFQSPVLMKWRTVYENVILPLEVQGKINRESHDHVMSLLALAGIDDFANSYPKELSGGMQQRVSICRSLVHDPSVLLLDEPFGALDAMTRSQMNKDLADIWEKSRKTALLITHSVAEAVFLGSRVVVMTPRPGQIAEIIDVPIPRPRTDAIRDNPVFYETVRRVSEHVGYEFV